jgi:pimeloyl-ACP methyl ester carboxylesterase
VLLSFTTHDGIRLRAEALGADGAPPVVLLHGGGQTRHAWSGTARSLAASGYRTIAVDLRGHGDSDWAPGGDYRLEAFAADVRDIAAQLASPAVFVGASLGGMSCLIALGEAPGMTAAGLVLVDVAHRFEMAGTDRILAFMRAAPDGFADPQEAVAAVSRYLPHREAPRSTTGIEKNLRLRDGRWRWHWDPALLGGSEGSLWNPADAASAGERLEAAVAALAIPALLVRGAISDVVTEAIADEFAVLVPHAQVITVDRAAHMVAGDDNDRFTQAVVSFLAGAAASPEGG